MRQFDIQFVNSIGLTKAGMGRCAIRARPWSAKYHTVSSYGAGISQDQYWSAYMHDSLKNVRNI